MRQTSLAIFPKMSEAVNPRNLIELLSNLELYSKGNFPPELLKELDRLRQSEPNNNYQQRDYGR